MLTYKTYRKIYRDSSVKNKGTQLVYTEILKDKNPKCDDITDYRFIIKPGNLLKTRDTKYNIEFIVSVNTQKCSIHFVNSLGRRTRSKVSFSIEEVQSLIDFKHWTCILCNPNKEESQ